MRKTGEFIKLVTFVGVVMTQNNNIYKAAEEIILQKVIILVPRTEIKLGCCDF